MTLTSHTFSQTVRNFISQTIFLQQKELSDIVAQCKHKNILVSFYAAAFISFLLLNNDNVPLLLEAKALEHLRAFLEQSPMVPFLPTSKFYFTITLQELEDGYLALLESRFVEVTAYFLWILARYTSTNVEVTRAYNDLVPVYVRRKLLPVIRSFLHHSYAPIRNFSRMILTQVGDVEYLSTNENIEVWVKSLSIGKDEKDLIKKFSSEGITLEKLYNTKISLDQTLDILKTLKLKAGVNFSLMGAIASAREDIESAKILAVEITDSVKAKERELSIQRKALKSEDSSLDLNERKKKAVFISYSWANKQSVKKLHENLILKGFDCWIDDHKMQGGAELFGEIDNGISDCQVFIACCSNNYGASANCQRELLLAFDRNKLIIPVLIATCDPWPPKGQMGPLLAGKIYIDLSSEEKFEKTVDQLVTTINQTLV